MHEFATFLFKNTRRDRRFGVQGPRGVELIAALRVGSAIDHPRHLRPTQGSGTHHTRLYGDVERTVLQVLTAQLIGCRSECLHFCMCRHIAKGLREVMCTGNDTVLADHDGTDRNLAFL